MLEDKLVKIESSDRGSFLVLSLQEVDNQRFPSRRFAVEVQLGDFRGRYDQVWVEQPSLERFVAEAKDLERTRSGSAMLEAMSPDEFFLRIQSVDAAGHIVLTTGLWRRQNLGGKPQRLGVEGSFEIDSSVLGSLIRGLLDLAS